MDCWTYNECSPERKAKCEAFPSHGTDCWRVTGTMCKGVAQLDISTKIGTCRKCGFYASADCQKF